MHAAAAAAACMLDGPACMNRYACTGVHADAAAAAAAAACMRACAAACVIDTMYQLVHSSAQTHAWRIEFSYRNIREY
jgi:hypothetical protein